jgi:serine/threonine protein kinase
MPINISLRCPSCGKQYKVSAEKLGQQAVCKQCGIRFTLSAEQPSTDESPVAAPQVDTAAVAAPQVGTVRSGLRDVPERIGRFEIRRRLGAGAFGAVYQAYDPLLSREVALKVPHAATLQSEKSRLRFFTEAKTAAQLRHPNIVPVYEPGQDGDTYYIVSAFIEGQTLEDAIDDQRPNFRHSAKLVKDLAGALAYAHKLGIVHRDIKPANIMLDAHGDPLLMDFGLARFEAEQSRLTIDGALLGTPAYMSPEQAARRNDQVGPASDQYSLGVVLYELLCGEPPFSGPPAVLIALVLNQEPVSPRIVNDKVPKDLETICLKAMAKRPSQRYADCTTLADDLRRWLADEPIQARPITALEKAYRWLKRHPAKVGLSGTLVILVFLGIVAIRQHSVVQKSVEEASHIKQQAEAVAQELEQKRKLYETATESAKDNDYVRQRLQELTGQNVLAEHAQPSELVATEPVSDPNSEITESAR